MHPRRPRKHQDPKPQPHRIDGNSAKNVRKTAAEPRNSRQMPARGRRAVGQAGYSARTGSRTNGSGTRGSGCPAPGRFPYRGQEARTMPPPAIRLPFTHPGCSTCNPIACRGNRIGSRGNPAYSGCNRAYSGCNPIAYGGNPIGSRCNPIASTCNRACSACNPAYSRCNPIASTCNPPNFTCNRIASTCNLQ